MLEHGGEAHDARSRSAHTIVNRMVVSGVSRSYRLQRTVALGGVQAEPPLLPMPRTSVRSAIQLQGPEFRLRVRQYVFDRGELHQVAGIARAESQTLPSIHYRTAKAQSDGRDAVFEGHRGHGIKIPRTHDS